MRVADAQARLRGSAAGLIPGGELVHPVLRVRLVLAREARVVDAHRARGRHQHDQVVELGRDVLGHLGVGREHDGSGGVVEHELVGRRGSREERELVESAQAVVAVAAVGDDRHLAQVHDQLRRNLLDRGRLHAGAGHLPCHLAQRQDVRDPEVVGEAVGGLIRRHGHGHGALVEREAGADLEVGLVHERGALEPPVGAQVRLVLDALVELLERRHQRSSSGCG